MTPSGEVAKLIIQIPCFNEEGFLAETLAALPRSVAGFDTVETLVIDDGSGDGTSEVARLSGATYLLRFPVHRGLARAFEAGLDAALKLGADVIVNTDADNQYRGEDVLLQAAGSWVVRQLSGTTTPDATSGFRAFSRRAALRLNVFTKFTYTLETVIQAGKKHIPIAHVPITANPDRRPSRLFGSLYVYMKHSLATLIRIYALYEPLKVFLGLGGLLVAAGGAVVIRFLVFYLLGHGAGHVQSLILGAVLFIVGFQTISIGLVADLIGNNRSLLEDTLYRVRELELRFGDGPNVVRLAGESPQRLEVRRGQR